MIEPARCSSLQWGLRLLVLLVLLLSLGRATIQAVTFTEQVLRLAKGAVR